MQRIAVVDDDGSFSEWLVILLQRAGYDALALWDGSKTLKRVTDTHREAPIALMIVDLFMPQPDGFEILRFARDELPGVPIIGMSGNGGRLLKGMLSLGAGHVIEKPFERTVLLDRIAELLAGELSRPGASSPATAGKPASRDGAHDGVRC